MPKRKSISDAEKCREALPMLSSAVDDTQNAKHYCRRSNIGAVLHCLDRASENLELARKALTQ